MDLIQHYIDKIYSETDVTKEFAERIGHEPHDRLILVDMDTDCYGHKERVQKRMFEKELNAAKEDGYYLA